MDSQADPKANVLQAIERGLAGLTFTDHYDTHPTEWPACEYDYDRLAEAVASLRQEFGDRIFIGHGIEICYQPEQMDRILPYLASREFDLVLLSVHWFGGRALHVRKHWDGLDAAGATRGYLEAVLHAVRFMRELSEQGSRPFDVLGHLDLVKRYTQRYFQAFDIRSFAGLVDEILRTCIETGIIPEVNLSTLRQSLPEPTPAEWVVHRYAELGGEAMTVGTDSHVPETIGQGIPEAIEMLRQQGLRYQGVFKRRELFCEPI